MYRQECEARRRACTQLEVPLLLTAAAAHCRCRCPQVVEGREDFDYTRHAAFCAFGFTYLGGFQYWLYNVKFTQVGAEL